MASGFESQLYFGTIMAHRRRICLKNSSKEFVFHSTARYLTVRPFLRKLRRFTGARSSTG
jgi:hypothetical protein